MFVKLTVTAHAQENKRWTVEEDTRLLEVAASGKPHVMIGAELKRSSASITGRL